MTSPVTKKSCPSRRRAAATSPCSSASRVAAECTPSGLPATSASTFSTTFTANPCRAPASRRKSAEPADQHLVDELLGREAREGLVEGQDDHGFEPEPAERHGLLALRRDAEDHLAAREIIRRMGLERQDRAGLAEPVRHGF